MDPSGAKFLEASIEDLTRLAELHVVAVAESEHGIFKILEAWSGSIFQIIPERLRVVRHLAVAVGNL